MNNARDELARTLGNALVDHMSAMGYASFCTSDLEAVLDGELNLQTVADAILAAGYRKPLTIENEKLLIEDGMLLLDVGSCTCTPYGSSHERHCGLEYLDDLTKPLARAGYTRPRTVSTVEELDALPEGTVVLSDAYRYMMHGGADCGWPVSFQKWPDGDWHRGARSSDTHPDNFLPASVLYEPEGK